VADLPIYLQMNFRLVDDKGALLDESRDLTELKQKWAKQAAASFRSIPDSDYERQGITSWDFADFPESVTLDQNGLKMTAFPALVDKGDSVDLTLMDTQAQSKQHTPAGFRRLFMLAQKDSVKYLKKNLPNIKTMCMQYSNVPASPFDNTQNDTSLKPSEQLITDLIHVAFDRCFILGKTAIRTKADFDQRLADNKGNLINIASELTQQFAKPLAEYHNVAKRLGDKLPLTAINAIKDIKEQLNHLIYLGCVHDMPDEALKRLPVYFQAIGHRLDKLVSDPTKDRGWAAQVAPHWQRYLSQRNKYHSDELDTYRWMIEEFRVSLFAQGLKTAYPISDKRLNKQWEMCK
jgi:ATP-dependent helicase HrpA